MIEISNISHRFKPDRAARAQPLTVLDNVSLTIETGKFVSFLGPSGCGKTTLLRIIDGLIRPKSGTVTINGNLVTKPDIGRTMVFQEFNLLPWRNAVKNVEFALELYGVPRAERTERAEDALRRVGLDR